ncbi:asparaginase [Brevibacterium paucivorans]
MRIHIAALGGTIASTDSDSGGVAPSATAQAIVETARIDTLPFPVDVTYEQVAQVGSGSITLDHVSQVVESAKNAREEGATAVVLTQGTDTLEETTFALSLMNDSGIPIVTTGAMRNPTLPGTDGPANVRSAIITAADPRIHMLPAVLVFADEVHDPSLVRKTHTTSAAPFSSGPGAGPLGWVSEDRLVFLHMPATLPGTLTRATSGQKAQVALVEATLDDSLAYVEFLKQAGYSAAVLAGVGGGHVSVNVLERVTALATQMPVVYCARTGAGRTLEATYGYPGAELDLQAAEMIPAGRLDARKARILSILALESGTKIEDVFSYFRQ